MLLAFGIATEDSSSDLVGRNYLGFFDLGMAWSSFDCLHLGRVLLSHSCCRVFCFPWVAEKLLLLIKILIIIRS